MAPTLVRFWKAEIICYTRVAFVSLTLPHGAYLRHYDSNNNNWHMRRCQQHGGACTYRPEVESSVRLRGARISYMYLSVCDTPVGSSS